jgi:hypothetical protein
MKNLQLLLVQAHALYFIATWLLLKSESGTSSPLPHF